MTQKIIPFSSTKLRQQWFQNLGGLKRVSIKNNEWKELLIDDGKNTLAIEGEFDQKLDLKQILQNKSYDTVSAQKVLNFFETAIMAYELAFHQFKEKEFKIEKSMILSMHASLYRNGVGREFSQTPGTWAEGAREIPGVNFTPLVGSHKIQKKMEEILWIVNEMDVGPTRKAAIFHCLFEHLHPFPGGNGRIGRIFMNFILLAHGLPSIAVKGLSDFDRNKYYEALRSADDWAEKFIKNQVGFSKVPQTFCSELENLFEKYLANSLDKIICNRYVSRRGGELLPLAKVAKILKKSENSFRVACSQKKYISMIEKGVSVTHPDLHLPPQ